MRALDRALTRIADALLKVDGERIGYAIDCTAYDWSVRLRRHTTPAKKDARARVLDEIADRFARFASDPQGILDEVTSAPGYGDPYPTLEVGVAEKDPR